MRHLWAGGRHVVRDGVVTGLDEDAVVTELRARAAAGTRHPAHDDLPVIQNRLLQHYRGGMHRGEHGSPHR